MANVAIITARGGSKRIPGKNTKLFRGKPVIAYVIDASISCGLFDEVMISTDSEEIAEVGRAFGATVPFYRNSTAADDFATTSDALIDVLTAYKKRNKVFETACCIYPTAPFVTTNKLIEAYHRLENGNFDTVFPVMAFSYPVFRGFELKDERINMLWPEYKNKRSQDIPNVYHDAGQFYFFKVNNFLKSGALITENASGIVISELEGHDIDTPDDWALAELKHQLLFKQS